MRRPARFLRTLRNILFGTAEIALFSWDTAHAAVPVYGGDGGLAAGLRTAAGLGGIVGDTSITQLIINVITFILNIVLILAVLAVIIAGLYLITSAGEEGQKEKAKKIIFYALIGILVVIFSRAIVIFVNHLF
ncbi:MAG: hypothetical protein WC840_05755 [Candidatus Peribacteraceae bacterium]